MVGLHAAVPGLFELLEGLRSFNSKALVAATGRLSWIASTKSEL